MYKKTVTYEDYNGVERTEDFYFNLSEAELTEMELTTTGGLSDMLKKIIATKDVPAITRMFKKLVLDAYGVKSDDGRRFIKTKELTEEFMQTEAYSKIFMELARDDDAAAKFVNGIVPKNISDKANKPAIAPAAL